MLFVPQGPRICAPFPHPVHQTEMAGGGSCKFFKIVGLHKNTNLKILKVHNVYELNVYTDDHS